MLYFILYPSYFILYLLLAYCLLLYSCCIQVLRVREEGARYG
jgi:hypothetical protein